MKVIFCAELQALSDENYRPVCLLEIQSYFHHYSKMSRVCEYDTWLQDHQAKGATLNKIIIITT